MEKMVAIIWLARKKSSEYEINFEDELVKLKSCVLEAWYAHAMVMIMVPERRMMNLGNSNSSELMVVKVRGMKMLKR